MNKQINTKLQVTELCLQKPVIMALNQQVQYKRERDWILNNNPTRMFPFLFFSLPVHWPLKYCKCSRIDHWPQRTSPPPELMERLVVPLKLFSRALSDSCCILYGMVYRKHHFGDSTTSSCGALLAHHPDNYSTHFPRHCPALKKPAVYLPSLPLSVYLFTSNLLPISQKQKSKSWLLLAPPPLFPIGTKGSPLAPSFGKPPT